MIFAILAQVRGALVKMRSLVTLKPSEVETPGGRSRERYRRAALTGLSAAATKGISIGVSLIVVPLTLHYLGVERNGMWLTMTSVIIMFGSADLGIGLGLVNMVADAMGREDRDEARRAVSSAFLMLTAIALVLLFAGAIAYPFVHWSSVFNVRSAAAIRESGPALMVFFLCFLVNLPLGVVPNTQTGLQSGFVNNQWMVVGSLLSLAALLLAIHLHAGLPVLILALTGTALLAVVFNGIQLFGSKHPELRPAIRYASLPAARRLLQSGLMFFVLGVCMSVAYQSDNVVIAQIMGGGAVSAYGIPARMFNLVASLLIMLSSAMWPAYTDAKARADGEWIRRSFLRTVKLGTALTSVMTVLLIIFGNRLLALWVGPGVRASTALLLAFGIRCVLNAYLQPINLLLNALNELKWQTILNVIMAAVNITLSILFVRRFGVIGAVLGTVVAEAVVLVVPMTMVLNRTLQRLTAA